MNSKTIQSPEGVALLMENMWLRHKAGMKQRSDNVFFVDLPPLTEEEREEIRRKYAFAYSSDVRMELCKAFRDAMAAEKRISPNYANS